MVMISKNYQCQGKLICSNNHNQDAVLKSNNSNISEHDFEMLSDKEGKSLFQKD